MTPRQEWISNQSEEFKKGYYAAASGLPDDNTHSKEWERGYYECLKDIEYGD